MTKKLVLLIYRNLSFVYSGWFPSIIFNNIYHVSYREQGCHKFVFEEGGLPDGTELGYYARGQVTYLIICVVISLFTRPSLLRYILLWAEIARRLQNGCWNILLLLQE